MAVPRPRLIVPIVVVAGGLALAAQSPPQTAGSPPAGRTAIRTAGLDPERLALIGPTVEAAIANHDLPGAVVVAGRGNRVWYRQAFGHRALVPAVETMTVDTIFDLASLTKVVATTTAVMQLVEDGRLRLTDRVADYVSGFGRYGKEGITIRHLLTHASGLRPDLDLEAPFEGEDEAIRRIVEEVPVAAPDERFIYSDINFELLGYIVERVSGQRLDLYVTEHIFSPLGMRDTGFLPAESTVPRIAPTQACQRLSWPCEPGAPMLRGVVHDPTARRMGGVAGHAGLFSTADDLSVFVRMLLAGGRWKGVRVLSPLAVAKMIRQATPEGLAARRGLGWDIDSAFSSNRGELLPIGSFGHTGFTGTSLWADPVTGVWVIFLSNRVHPDGHGDVVPVRSRVATIVASAASDVQIPPRVEMTGADFGAGRSVPLSPHQPVATGIDVLRTEGFARLAGRHIGLVTNQSGRASDGASTIDLLHDQPGVSLVALFSPEHGIRGVLDESVPSSTDERTGLPIYSLYGRTRRPTDDMLRGIDTLVVDLQDVGVRFYTYTTTMAYVMEEAARRHVKVVVLDRPNPVNGWLIEGPPLDADAVGFTGYLPKMPIRHGMTLGEVARLLNEEAGIHCDLDVVAMLHWDRSEWYDQTGLEWVNPSPNMRRLTEATLYPGIGMLEYANVSVGRGTDTPFEQIGAPWIDGRRLADALNGRNLPGVRVYPVTFTPSSSTYAGEPCHGVSFVVTDREAFRPVRFGLEVAAALVRLHGDHLDFGRTSVLLGSAEAVARLKAGQDPDAIVTSWEPAAAAWRLLRAKYLLY